MPEAKKISKQEENSLNCPSCDNKGTIVADYERISKTCDNTNCRVLYFNATPLTPTCDIITK